MEHRTERMTFHMTPSEKELSLRLGQHLNMSSQSELIRRLIASEAVRYGLAEVPQKVPAEAARELPIVAPILPGLILIEDEDD